MDSGTGTLRNTKLTVRIDYELEGALDWICDELLGAVGFHVVAGLSQFLGLLEKDAEPASALGGGGTVCGRDWSFRGVMRLPAAWVVADRSGNA